jgi:hypothetical protein
MNFYHNDKEAQPWIRTVATCSKPAHPPPSAASWPAPGSAALAQAQLSAAPALVVPPLAAKIGMRLATCTLDSKGAPTVVAVLDNGRLIDLQAESRRQKRPLPFDASSMVALIKSGNAGLEQVRAVAEGALSRPASLLPIERARFMSPIPRPERNIYCVGWNYLDHFSV